MPRHYLFPRTIFASRPGIIRQLLHVFSEFMEIITALLRRDYEHACHECYDLIGSVETLIHKLYIVAHARKKPIQPLIIKLAVEEKNRKRGYYA